MKIKITRRRDGKHNVYELNQVTRLADVPFCSLKTKEEILEIRRNDSSCPSFVVRFAMFLAHGAKEWKSEGRFESDSSLDDAVSFYSFNNRQNARVFLVNADAKETWENAFFTVSEEVFRNIFNQLEATKAMEENESGCA